MIFKSKIYLELEIFEEFFNLNPGVLESRGITKRQCRSVEGGYAAAHLAYTPLRLTRAAYNIQKESTLHSLSGRPFWLSYMALAKLGDLAPSHGSSQSSKSSPKKEKILFISKSDRRWILEN
jgi:hypothetical protein